MFQRSFLARFTAPATKTVHQPVEEVDEVRVREQDRLIDLFITCKRAGLPYTLGELEQAFLRKENIFETIASQIELRKYKLGISPLAAKSLELETVDLAKLEALKYRLEMEHIQPQVSELRKYALNERGYAKLHEIHSKFKSNGIELELSEVEDFAFSGGSLDRYLQYLSASYQASLSVLKQHNILGDHHAIINSFLREGQPGLASALAIAEVPDALTLANEFVNSDNAGGFKVTLSHIRELALCEVKNGSIEMAYIVAKNNKLNLSLMRLSMLVLKGFDVLGFAQALATEGGFGYSNVPLGFENLSLAQKDMARLIHCSVKAQRLNLQVSLSVVDELYRRKSEPEKIIDLLHAAKEAGCDINVRDLVKMPLEHIKLNEILEQVIALHKSGVSISIKQVNELYLVKLNTGNLFFSYQRLVQENVGVSLGELESYALRKIDIEKATDAFLQLRDQSTFTFDDMCDMLDGGVDLNLFVKTFVNLNPEEKGVLMRSGLKPTKIAAAVRAYINAGVHGLSVSLRDLTVHLQANGNLYRLQKVLQAAKDLNLDIDVATASYIETNGFDVNELVGKSLRPTVHQDKIINVLTKNSSRLAFKVKVVYILKPSNLLSSITEADFLSEIKGTVIEYLNTKEADEINELIGNIKPKVMPYIQQKDQLMQKCAYSLIDLYAIDYQIL